MFQLLERLLLEAILKMMEEALLTAGLDDWFYTVVGLCVDGGELRKLRFPFISKVYPPPKQFFHPIGYQHKFFLVLILRTFWADIY